MALATEFTATWSLEPATTHRRTIEEVGRRLIERLADALSANSRGALRLECRLDCAAGEPVRMRIDLFRPTAEPAHLMELLGMQLHQQRVRAAVRRVTVAVPHVAPLVWRQRELFEEGSQEHPRELALLVDRLRGRLGPQQVVRARLAASAQPERAYQELSGAGILPAKSARQAGNRQAGSLPHSTRQARCLPHGQVRPLRLFSPPQPLHVVSLASMSLASGPPAMVRRDGQPHTIVRHWGPERIETTWWRGRCVRRDYYRLETQSGSRLWVFRRLQDGRWFLHGEFE